jgi:hypothetical protein
MQLMLELKNGEINQEVIKVRDIQDFVKNHIKE